MSVAKPHYLLFSKAKRSDDQGGWSFVLQAADGSAKLEAEDLEPNTYGERLELLAVVRGLEALDQPSRVTLVTPSRYVKLGLAYGLDEWRRQGWTWECFGQMVPIKNRDLWQRLDRALHFHQLDRRVVRIDGPHQHPGQPLHGHPLEPGPARTPWTTGEDFEEDIGGQPPAADHFGREARFRMPVVDFADRLATVPPEYELVEDSVPPAEQSPRRMRSAVRRPWTRSKAWLARRLQRLADRLRRWLSWSELWHAPWMG